MFIIDLFANLSRPRLCALLDHFAKIKEARQACISSGDDYDDIVD
jgi:hypothetical protein